jgi:oxygen-independent coproporphyrinogen-3 oxidase
VNTSLSRWLEQGHYQSYAYSYPHKTAYRPLDPAVSLREVWRDEDRSALFLYLHVPFCEQRCGFCNLFTQVSPPDDAVQAYLGALEREASVVDDLLGQRRFARLAVGGGTPTFLEPAGLERLFRVIEKLGAAGVPASIETSPSTLDEARVDVLGAFGVQRVSMGVQSFDEAEVSRVQRRQRRAEVERAFGCLRSVIPVRNLDLMYGLPGQTDETFVSSIEAAVECGANELYLYPLYVRPLTILGRRTRGAPDSRLSLYRAGRDWLSSRGWRQVSMRMFASPDRPADAVDGARPYRCQSDAMVGLGPGARSYTRSLHYALPFAVRQEGIRDVIREYAGRTSEAHAFARHGFVLDVDEQRRRTLLLSLLEGELVRHAYRARFGEDVMSHFPQLEELVATGLGVITDASIRLVERGIECADVIGLWLESDAVRLRRAEWSPR